MKSTLLVLILTLILSVLSSSAVAQINFEYADSLTPYSGNFRGVREGSISFADIDNDGDEDVLITGGYKSTLYRNLGDGLFDELSSSALPFVSYSTSDFADIDGDGDQDLLISGYDTSYIAISELFLNDGNGVFTIHPSTIDGVEDGSVAFEDVDNDNDPDLMITGYNYSNGYVSKLYNNDGAGNFTEVTGTPFENISFSCVAFEDIDNDGDSDILIMGQKNGTTNRTIIYKNNGSGVFTHYSYLVGKERGAVDFSDIDNDGDPDLITTGEISSGSKQTHLFTNDGNGNFTSVSGVGAYMEHVSYSGVRFGDVDNDGDEDLIYTGLNSPSNPITKLFKNDGSGNFTVNYSSEFIPVSDSDVELVDVDGDNDLDLISSGFNGNGIQLTLLYLNNGAGVFTEMERSTFLGLRDSQVDFIDIDNDGDQDIFVSGYTNITYDPTIPTTESRIYLNDGNGQFSVHTQTPFDSIFSDFHFRDLDNDGDIDIFLNSQNPANSNDRKIKHYTNNGAGVFTEQTGTPFTGLIQFNELSCSDIDGDNDLDVLIIGWDNSYDDQIKLFKNDGNGNFTEVPSTPFNSVNYNTKFIFIDADSDNDNDILVTNESSSSPTTLYLNDGNGNFTSSANLAFSSIKGDLLSSSDIDNDGDADVLFTWYDGTNHTTIYKNDGNGSFTITSSQMIGLDYSAGTFADFNNDSYDDLIISGLSDSYGKVTRVYENDRLGNFNEVSIPDLEGLFHGDIAVSDINSDGKIDLFLTGGNHNENRSSILYLNNSCPTGNSYDTIVACYSHTWIDGNTYTSSNNTARYTIPGGAANGCDSIISLNLTILSPGISTDVQSACNSYTWIDGNTYTTSNNTATDTIFGGAANGCDSIIQLDLTILSPVFYTDIQTACSAYTWIDGITYTSSNYTASYTYTNTGGCDSTVTLNLTFVDTYQIGSDIDGEDPDNSSGSSISMPDAYTVAIGAYLNDGNGSESGHVRIYELNGNNWTQKGADIDGEAAGDRSGSAISMPDANTVAIGAPLNSGNGTSSGHVRIFEWNGSTWTQKGADIDGEAAGDRAGNSVSMPDANTVAVGAFYNDGTGGNSGHVRIFEWNGSTWTQKGTDINGGTVGERSGSSVSMPDANTIAIGAYLNDGNGNNSGTVRIFKWNGSTWTQKGTNINGEDASDYSGSAVSMPDANTVAIGAASNDGNGNESGHVRIFKWTGSSWVKKGTDIDGEAADDRAGTSISMPDANTIAVGAILNDGNGANSGHVRVFEWDGSDWIQNGLDIDGEAIDDHAGVSVSMPNANIVAIGANLNDENGNNAGHVRVYSVSTENTIDIQTACNSYTWMDGITYTTSNNTATYVLTNSRGCDSTIVLDLTINHPVNVTDTITACGPYTWIDGITYTTSNNTATYIMISSGGCDSTITLDLTINSPTTGSDIQTACGSYTWIDGNTYTSSNNTATDTIYGGAVNGCDSIITLDLTILPPSYGIDVISACNSYTWMDGNTYTSSNNTATHTLVGAAANGCDSIVTLDLTILTPSYSTDIQSACDSYTWIDGNTYTSSNNTAIDTIFGGASNGCDSIISLDLTINPINSSITIQDTTATAYPAGASYQWLDCNNGLADISGETSQVFTTSTSGDYAVEITFNGCTDTAECAHIQYCDLNSNFMLTDMGGGLYEFTSNSSGLFNSILWNFGDGTTLLNASTAQHTFQINGPMSSSLTVKDTNYLPIGACSDLSYQTFVISGVTSPLSCQAGFIVISDTTSNNITVINNATGSNLTYSWDFGDGNTSSQAQPTHTYNSGGPFNLCLTIDDQNGCSDTYCDSINKYGSTIRQSGFTINIISSDLINESISINEPAIKYYPNPAQSYIYFEDLPDDILAFNIVNEIGEIVKIITPPGYTKADISDLADGMYYIIIKSSTKTSVLKFSKI